jgi:hypothetical protein
MIAPADTTAPAEEITSVEIAVELIPDGSTKWLCVELARFAETATRAVDERDRRHFYGEEQSRAKAEVVSRSFASSQRELVERITGEKAVVVAQVTALHAKLASEHALVVLLRGEVDDASLKIALWQFAALSPKTLHKQTQTTFRLVMKPRRPADHPGVQLVTESATIIQTQKPDVEASVITALLSFR